MNQHDNYHHPVVAVKLPQIITDQRSNYHPTVMAQAHYNVDGVTKGSGARVSSATTIPCLHLSSLLPPLASGPAGKYSMFTSMGGDQYLSIPWSWFYIGPT